MKTCDKDLNESIKLQRKKKAWDTLQKKQVDKEILDRIVEKRVE